MHSGCNQQCNTTSVAFNSQLCWLCFVTRHQLDPTQRLTSITDVQISTRVRHSSSIISLMPNVSQTQFTKISNRAQQCGPLTWGQPLGEVYWIPGPMSLRSLWCLHHQPPTATKGVCLNTEKLKAIHPQGRELLSAMASKL